MCFLHCLAFEATLLYSSLHAVYSRELIAIAICCDQFIFFYELKFISLIIKFEKA